MIRTDEDALICDLAETYKIYDYRSLPVRLVATLSVGLRDDSRIKMKLGKAKTSSDKYMLAGIFDKLSQLVWLNTKDGAKGRNFPKSLLASFDKQEYKSSEKEVIAFSSGSDFKAYRESLIGGGR